MDSESDKSASPQPEQPVENRRLKRLPKTTISAPIVADVPSEPKPEPPPPVKIIDERLHEEDAKVEITVNIFGRTQVIVDRLVAENIVHNAFLTPNRSAVIGSLRRMFEDMFQAAVTRFNMKVGVQLPEEDSKPAGGNGHKLFQGEIPPYKGDTLPPLHIDPDPGLKAPETN